MNISEKIGVLPNAARRNGLGDTGDSRLRHRRLTSAGQGLPGARGDNSQHTRTRAQMSLPLRRVSQPCARASRDTDRTLPCERSWHGVPSGGGNIDCLHEGAYGLQLALSGDAVGANLGVAADACRGRPLQVMRRVLAGEAG